MWVIILVQAANKAAHATGVVDVLEEEIAEFEERAEVTVADESEQWSWNAIKSCTKALWRQVEA